MSERLKGKVAIITGAGTGIGRACALAYAREGAMLVLVGRRTEKLESVAQECGTDPLIIPLDVSSPSAVDSLMAEDSKPLRRSTCSVKQCRSASRRYGRAGYARTMGRDVQHKRARCLVAFTRLFFRTCEQAGGGSIINIASVLGINGARLRAAYAASKGAVVLLTKCMAIDHGHEKIRVNAICPSFIETDLTAAYIRNTPDPDAVRRERISVHPLGRLGEPEDMAGIAVYLASDESSWATGAVYPVDGGYLAV